ncbi:MULTISPECIES: site-specific DNA-methyltransferase [unclassified Chelatococcus]|uniref:DNA-methyltransferase n=1 Tax=unclassified Chelatococcus TaxID=2638111 RepID=UPI001BCD828C|nr:MULTISPECIES: site-specific DNA-methyltransferase [unclassified Chelatococcus]CAH1670626.1 Methyltransferase [Hyphomicrobiales bacterium]MBS7738359.1 site-specific DNA-methyltransferase [Chelatococcus sp. HY11]MBX3545887.1 site-specific DNA-methyltransferase [Chelatococcus sp.]MCO5077295.1 site-specific DNA-methyltransferase [Chelatococcus sp.]CAH1677140.1 Methyltransferase [Hyphomicrobiales bacterium]
MSKRDSREGGVTILLGDVRTRLRELPADYFDCVVTSPPYWGLRDYGVAGQIGLEATLGEHLAVMVDLFREVRRVLKPSGTLWLNYGDCYATTPNGRSAADVKAAGGDDRTFRDKPMSTIGGAIKAKDLCMIPNRLAIALQEDGWWVRSEIVWAKPNAMPDSAKDRPAVAHEKVFLLSKSARYFYDAEEVRFALRPKTLTTYGTTRAECADDGSGKVKKANFARSLPARKPREVRGRDTYGRHTLGEVLPDNEEREGREKIRGLTPRHAGQINHTRLDETPRGEGRNLRNYEPAPVDVWVIATKPFRGAHFATFPPELVERCLRAGCPPDGRVLDPFGGAGTTAVVAEAFGLECTLIELNPEYAEIARGRLALMRASPLDAKRMRAVQAGARPEPGIFGEAT